MPFKPGHKKHGGRKKGQPNKASLKAEEIAESVGCDPLKILCMFAVGDWEGLGYKGPHPDPLKSDIISKEQRLRAAVEASQYMFPKRKAIDHTIKPKIRHEVENLDGTVDVYTNEDE